MGSGYIGAILDMTISLSEIKFLIRLVSVPPIDGWYNIKNTKDGTTTRNLMSVVASRLKNDKKLLEFNGKSKYRPNAKCWELLKEFHNEIALPLTKIFEKETTHALPKGL